MKNITLVGPLYIVENLLQLFSGEPLCFQFLSHEEWYKMKFSRKIGYLQNTNIMHFLWGQRKLGDFIFAKILGIRIINHYIGTDVWRLMKEKPSKKFKAYLSNLLADRVFCVSAGLQKELSLLGTQAKILPLAFGSYPDIVPQLPKRLNVYSYVPESRSEFYGWSFIEQLIRQYPDIQFYILANKGNGYHHYPNVEFLGWQDDIRQWIKDSYIYLRLTQHDGLPKMILEALAYGRQVIFSGEFPHCHRSTNFSELKSCFDNLLNKPKLNHEGAKFVREEYNSAKIRQTFVSLYRELIAGSL